MQPRAEDYSFDLDRALQSVVGLRATMPSDAFTAQTLGTERAGHGVMIRSDGLILTIGYLITEAEQIWLHLADGRAVPGHALAFDQATGFGLVQALARVDLPALPLGNSSALKVGEAVVVGGAGGRKRSVAAQRGRQAGIRRLLGICAGRGDLHRALASELGRNGADRCRRANLLGIGSLQLEAQRRQGHQHGRADRSAEAGDGRTAEPTGAARDRRSRGLASMSPIPTTSWW